MHVSVDVETRWPITFEITDERITDQEMLRPLLKDVKQGLANGRSSRQGRHIQVHERKRCGHVGNKDQKERRCEQNARIL